MARGFRRSRGGAAARLDVAEVILLGQLLDQLVTLVAPDEPAESDPLARAVGISTSTVVPRDPALARLLPDGYGPGDEELASEFRRYTELGLRQRKVADALAVRGALPPEGGMLRLDLAAAETWLRTLTDLRLALGTRLEVDASIDDLLETLDDDDPRLAGLTIYSWLGWLQETLVRSIW